MSMTYRDRHLEADLLRKEVDDKALGRVLAAKRDTLEIEKGGTSLTFSEGFLYYKRLLADIHEGLACECCGFKNLIHVKRVGGHILGPECSKPGHPFGTCKRAKA